MKEKEQVVENGIPHTTHPQVESERNLFLQTQREL